MVFERALTRSRKRTLLLYTERRKTMRVEREVAISSSTWKGVGTQFKRRKKGVIFFLSLVPWISQFLLFTYPFLLSCPVPSCPVLSRTVLHCPALPVLS